MVPSEDQGSAGTSLIMQENAIQSRSSWEEVEMKMTTLSPSLANLSKALMLQLSPADSQMPRKQIKQSMGLGVE